MTHLPPPRRPVANGDEMKNARAFLSVRVFSREHLYRNAAAGIVCLEHVRRMRRARACSVRVPRAYTYNNNTLRMASVAVTPSL